MNHRRPTKGRRHSGTHRPPFLLGFSPFARSLSLAAARTRKSLPRDPSSSSTPSKLSPKRAKTSNCKQKSPVKRCPPSSSSSSDDDDDDDNQEHDVEMIQAEFGFFDPKPSDFHGVKLLLQNYLDSKPWDLSGFVDLILEQNTVGTVVKPQGDDQNSDDDDDEAGLFAIISALNLGRYTRHKCIGELKEFLLEVCGNENEELRSLLCEKANKVGILVSRRFVNCPHQLVPPLYDALFDEISWATEDEPTQELRDSFRFKYYILITKIFMNENIKRHKSKPSRESNEPIIYIKSEDEIFQELSSFSFTFNLHAEQSMSHELRNYKPMGLVLIVNAKEIPKFQRKLKSLLCDS